MTCPQHYPQPAALLTDQTDSSSGAAILTGVSSQLTGQEKFNHGSPWNTAWLDHELNRAERHAQNAKGLL